MMRSLAFLLVFFLSAPATLFAAEVTKVKGSSALVDLKGDAASPGDQFFGIKSNGKRGAILRIVKVKGEKAIAKVLKGTATAGMTLEFKPAKSAKSGGAMASGSGDGGGRGMSAGKSRSYWGGLFGLGMDKMTVNVETANGTQSVAMSGMGFSAKGLFDYELFKQVWFRGTAGLEGFSTSGSAICGDGSASCDAKIFYIDFDFIGRYMFSTGNVRPWLGGGIGLLFPATKSASALDSSSISTTNVIIVGGGLDWFISPTMYIPVSVEYDLLPKSNEVEASAITLRAGFAVPF